MPASNAAATTTAFTLTISPGAAAIPMANGFYASTITVTPNNNPAQAAQIPVCLEVGNNVVTQFETVPQPDSVPLPFNPTGNIVPADGLVTDAGNTVYLQVIAETLGPNQTAPLNAGATFGTPSFVAVPVSITPASTNPPWAFRLASPVNTGASNCSPVSGAPTGHCLTGSHLDFLIAAPSDLSSPPVVTFNVAATGTGLPSATHETINPSDSPSPSCQNAVLPVYPLDGPALIYTVDSPNCLPGCPASWCTSPQLSTLPTVLAYLTLIPSLGYTGGLGYTTVPNVSFSSGCAEEPTAVATIVHPGAAGYVSTIGLTGPGSGCTSAPTVTIDPPSTVGGVTAAVEAFLANATTAFTFNQLVDTAPTSARSCMTGAPSCSGPWFQTLAVQASNGGVSILTPTLYPPAPTIYYNPQATGFIGPWLSVASVNCQPIVANPTPVTECQFTVSPNANVTELPVGTYNAYVDFVATGQPPNTEPAIVTALVTLNVTGLPSVVSTPSAAFIYASGSSATNPASVSAQLSVSALPNGVTGIPVTVTAASETGPANWLQIALNGGTAGVAPESGTLTTTPLPLVITVNPAVLASLTTPNTYNGTITVSTPSSSTSNPTVTIPVTLTMGTQLLQINSNDASCSTASGIGSCIATAAYTIGQTNQATPSFPAVVNMLGSVPYPLSFSSNVPWLVPSVTTSSYASVPLSFAINPSTIPPLSAGLLTGVITATEVGGPLSATFTVNLTVANPPSILLPTPTCTPNPAGYTTSVVCTTTAALSTMPANPTTLPATVTASMSSGPCTVAPATSTISLSTAATPLSFTVSPSSGIGLFANCTLAVAVATTSGITPAITNSTSATITLTGSLTTSPTSQVINLPTGAAPVTFTDAIQMTSSAGPAPVSFACSPSIALPLGGDWLACTGGTTTTVPPAATSTGTVTASSLPAGSYGGSLAYSLTQLGPSVPPINVPVTLEIGTLAITGGPVTFEYEFGVTVPATNATLMISSGVAAINWTATVTPNAGTANCNWLIPGALSGTTTSNTPNPLTVSYNPAVLPAANATYSCTISYSPAAVYGAPAADTVPVVVTLLTGPVGFLVVTPNTAQVLTTIPGSTAAPGATFEVGVSQILAPATSITATVTPFSNNPLSAGPNSAPIFTASPAALTIPSPPGAAALTITANPTGLPIGTYQGSFTISSPSLPVTAVVTVDLVLACAAFVSQPSTVALTNSVPADGSTPTTASGTFSLTVNAGCALPPWTATSNVPWLAVTLGSGTGTYSALSNPTTSPRTGVITVTPSVGAPGLIQFTQPASSAPLLDRQVTALYQSILSRDPDPGGYAFWTGPGAPTGVATLSQMADDFLTSPEAFNSDFAVMAAYQAATGAPPTYAQFTSAVSAIRLGGQTVPGLFTALTAANLSYSAESLYRNLLSRAPTAAEAGPCTALAACFQTLIGYPAATTPASAANNEFQSTGSFANVASAAGDHTNALYITMLYFVILDRDPDPGGLAFWVNAANSGGAGLLFQGPAGYAIRLQILGPAPGQGFAGSPEFQGLFQ